MKQSINFKSKLGLPIEEQEKLAVKEGKSLEQWIDGEKNILKKEMLRSAREFLNTKGKRPDGWTDKDEKSARIFQLVVDSEVPGWAEEQEKIAAKEGKTLDQWIKEKRKEIGI